MSLTKKVFYLFIKRILLVLFIYQICRFLFYIFNYSFFNEISYLPFLGGIRFDLSAIAYINIIFVILHFLPIKQFTTVTYQKLLSIAFVFVNAVFIATNFIDFQYYKFTNRRSTFSLITAKGMEQEIGGLLISYVVDYWYIPVAFGIVIYLFWRFLPKYRFNEVLNNSDKKKLSVYMLFFLIAFIILGRGGFQKKPLRIVDSNLYSTNHSTALVLNTPFTILKTIDNKERLENYNFYTEEELNAIFTPIQSFAHQNPNRINVIILILESFGKENLNIGQTPFLDSLATQSLNFTNAYANGKLSIDAVPSIISSIPSLMNNSVIASSYAVNKVKGLPAILSENGYFTSFFHGAFNGSQNFDQYCKQAGFDKYYGKNEYIGPEAFDGKWGIFDEEFLQFFANEIATFKEPFFTGLFTISSHAPYVIPEKHKNKFSKGTNEFHETIAYTDYALSQFFKTAKSKPWYNNTLFIITADHTSSAKKTAEFNTPIGHYKIPLLFFKPGDVNFKGEIEKNMQQIDILPSLLDILKIKTEVITYGKSFKSDANYVVNYSNNVYNYINKDYYLAFNGKESILLYNIKKDPLLLNNLVDKELETKVEMEQFIKAYIQSFNQRMSNNQLTLE